MSTGLTLEKAQQKYNTYLEAEEAILTAKEYAIDGRSVKREDLKEIRAGLQLWESKCNQLASGAKGGARVFRGIIKND
jgi:hypothetical protein